MEECKINHDALYRLMEIKCERETLEYVLDGMKKVLGEDLPDADQVQAYLMSPDKPTSLNLHQQMVAMDKLLECAEVNFRTTCDMLRYRQMKRAGVVSSVEEFLQLLHPGECEEEWNEEI
ncbi:hypothetical protein H9X86_09580 [Pseudoflavonifractor capillosus]|uniref:hypothetical protein n=1 Tax=Pseudoflavonifractor capillosus TaxID=106588 RepID=UPI001957473E|nr:hypothetical protein [Pseudoflavonifractor capillosus]MBM6897607.1 hypothetical protein [Pseudoflavonifractor capillosus]